MKRNFGFYLEWIFLNKNFWRVRFRKPRPDGQLEETIKLTFSLLPPRFFTRKRKWWSISSISSIFRYVIWVNHSNRPMTVSNSSAVAVNVTMSSVYRKLLNVFPPVEISLSQFSSYLLAVHLLWEFNSQQRFQTIRPSFLATFRKNAGLPPFPQPPIFPLSRFAVTKKVK